MVSLLIIAYIIAKYKNLKSNYILHEKKLYLSLGPFVYYNGGG